MLKFIFKTKNSKDERKEKNKVFSECLADSFLTCGPAKFFN